MPNCFTLTRKSEPEKGPVKLNVIDEDICRFFGKPVHLKHWYMGWFDMIGFDLAMGQTFPHIIDKYAKRSYYCYLYGDMESVEYLDHMIEIAKYLDAVFIPDNFVEIGRKR